MNASQPPPPPGERGAGQTPSPAADHRLAKEEMARRKAEERARREEETQRQAEELRKMREEEERKQEEERRRREREEAERLQRQVRRVLLRLSTLTRTPHHVCSCRSNRRRRRSLAKERRQSG